MDKETRQKIIVKLINDNKISNQNELLEYMKKKGCPSTQATISRDIKELKVIKQTDKNGKTKYVVNDFVNFAKLDEGIYDMFSKLIISVGIVGNIVILICKNATAQAVCLTFDKMEYEGVAGTVSGYNTIFILMKNEDKAVQLKKDIENRI